MLFELHKLDPEEETGTDDDSYSVLMRTLNVEFADVCGESYNGRGTIDSVDAKWFVTAKRNDDMFSLDSVKKDVPSDYNGVLCKQFLDETQYNVVYFIDPTNPHEWFGFASYSYSEDTGTEYVLGVTLEMIFIKPKYRNTKLGYVTAYELGRLISEGVVFYGDKITKNTSSVSLISYSQGCNEAGAICLERFYDGLRMHFSDIEFYDDGQDYAPLTEIELVDEY